MKAIILTIGLMISMAVSSQELNGLDVYTTTYNMNEKSGVTVYNNILESYVYEFNRDQVPAREEIGMVITELKRVLELNGRTLDSYDELIPVYNIFNSFDPIDIMLEMQASFHVGFRYIMGEYSIYMYGASYIEGNYSVGIMIEKTSEY
jgi:hypothetical protein